METIDAPTRERLIKTLALNWNEETEGALTYEALAAKEEDFWRKRTLLELAAAERGHAAMWLTRILELGAPAPVYDGPPDGRANRLVNRIGGPNSALRRIELDEIQDIARYGKQLKEIGDEPSIAILREVILDEQGHSRKLKSLIVPVAERRPAIAQVTRPRSPQDALTELRSKRTHRSPASWIGDAIYGVNDGLGAIFGIVSGVSGATAGNSHYVLLAGLAGGIASALSMGAGAYLAATSEREIYEGALYRKREEVMENPDDARREASLIYQVKGIPEADADHMAEHLAADPENLLRALAADDLNVTEEGLSNPIVSAVSGALSTAVGAFIPVIPFFFMTGTAAIITAAVISLIAHFAVGAAKTIITVRPWWQSGLQMTLVGALEGIATYVIGIGLGHAGA